MPAFQGVTHNIRVLIRRLNKVSLAIQSPVFLRPLLFQHVLAGVEHRPVLEANFKDVIDIGAHHGQFSLAARLWCPKSRIFAFEPQKSAAEKYRHVFKNDGNVNLFQAAIGPVTGEATMHIMAADDSSSLLPSIDETFEVGTETIRLGKLTDFIESIERPALLKLDVQGYELEALRGCDSLLEDFACIYVECSFVQDYKRQALAHEVIDWLHPRGFKLTGVYNSSYGRYGKPIQADCLFEKLKI